MQRTTIAVLVKDGKVLSYGTNEHKEPCKRVGYPTGEGYELCEGCDYDNHAEANALRGIISFCGVCEGLIRDTPDDGGSAAQCGSCGTRVHDMCYEANNCPGIKEKPTLYLIGHTYACEPCKQKAAEKGITIKVI